MSLVNVYGARREAEVMQNTWGHLAPEKDRVYTGHFTFALGCFGDLAVVGYEFEDLDDSPWFHEHLHDWIWDNKPEEGCVYRFDGTYDSGRIDRFVGTLKPLEVTR